MTDNNVLLYRPVGPKELQLIRDSGFLRFPPRLPEQPIFYPVLTLEYAEQIARDWNVKASGYGAVTAFRVRTIFLDRYDVHQVGSQIHREYWIPAEDLDEFNDNIVGPIEVVVEFGAKGNLPSTDEGRRILRGPATAPGGSLRRLVATSDDPDGCLDRCRNLLVEVITMISYRPEFPSIEEWSALLPSWFVDACTPSLSPEQAEGEVARWRRLNPQAQARYEDESLWTLEDWIYWFDPSSDADRGWRWWNSGVTNANHFWIDIEVEGDPAPVGTLKWLIRAAGATRVSESQAEDA